MSLSVLQEVLELKELTLQLKAADKELRVFAADEHRYEMRPTLSEVELEEFEAQHGILLPEDYRLFLREVSNGGVGPDYGLQTLDVKSQDYNLSRPFLLTQGSDFISKEEFRAGTDNHRNSGLLTISEQGCGYFSYLVVNGTSYGTIWTGGMRFFPSELTFSAWYRKWVEKELRQMLNEPLVDQLKVGMTKDEVIEVTGETWKERIVGDERLYESPNFRAQLRLDEQGNVFSIYRY